MIQKLLREDEERNTQYTVRIYINLYRQSRSNPWMSKVVDNVS